MSKYLNGFRVTKNEIEEALAQINKAYKGNRFTTSIIYSISPEVLDYLASNSTLTYHNGTYILTVSFGDSTEEFKFSKENSSNENSMAVVSFLKDILGDSDEDDLLEDEISEDDL